MQANQFKLCKVPVVVGGIMVVGVLMRCAHCFTPCDLKALLMNVQHSLIWELMLCGFELDHNVTEAMKNICYAKGEGAVDHSMVQEIPLYLQEP